MGRRIRRTNRRSNLRRVRKNTMKRKSMKRKSMKRRNTLKRKSIKRRNTIRRRNTMRGNFRWMRGGMQAAPAAPASPAAPSLDTFDEYGVNLVRFGKTDGEKQKLVEIGSKPLFNANMDKQSIEELLSGASAVYVPSELKKQGDNEPSSNFRSTDARISGVGSSEDGTIWSTATNDTLIENIIKLIQSPVPYFQTALPRDARVLKEGAVSFTGDYTTTKVNTLNSRDKPAIAPCVNPGKVEELLKPRLKTVEERGITMGIPDLKTATAGAYNCTMLADVFSFIALVNLATKDERYMPYFAPRNILYKENSSATVDGKAPGKDRPDGGKSNEKRTFRCIHFYDDPAGYPLTDYVQDKGNQAGVVEILYNDFLEFLDENPDTAFKNKVKKFFDKYYIERLSDNFHNDIDDDLLFVLLMGIGIPIDYLMV